MAFSPIMLAPSQFQKADGTPASGYVLKAYVSGTTNTQQLATSKAGTTLVNSIVLDSNGYPSYGGSVILPHIDDTVSYKLALFIDADAAESGTPAVWSIDSNDPILLDATFSTSDTTNNGITSVISATHSVTNTPAAGIGTGIDFVTETGGGNHTGMVLASVATDVADTTEDFDLVVKLISGGSAAAEVFRVTATGEVKPASDIVFQGADPQVLGNDPDGEIYIGPSTTNALGGNIVLYGQSHSTKAGDIELRNTSTVELGLDNSESTWDFADNSVIVGGTVYITEQASANADTAGDGQLWVKNTAPNTLFFTDDAGTDFQVATLAGTEALTEKTYSGTALDVKDTVYAITDGGSVDIDPANGRIQTWALGANRTPTASNMVNGQSVKLYIDDGTTYAITWTTIGVVWLNNGGSAPALATSGYSVVVLEKVGGTVYGFVAGNQT